MQDTEYKAMVYAETRTVELICARDDAIAHAEDFAEELSRAYANAALAEQTAARSARLRSRLGSSIVLVVTRTPWLK
jgi:predicted ATPase